jgi:hypothetical protein
MISIINQIPDKLKSLNTIEEYSGLSYLLQGLLTDLC